MAPQIRIRRKQPPPSETAKWLKRSLVYIKLLILWGLVLLADHFLEFRFEYLWPFWLFLRSVYDSFKYQGLAFSVFFICIAITSDMICFLFIPVHWLFFAASTYVWVQYVWHTEKGFCVPTVFLWLLFVYIEASIRLKEFKAHLDLKHLPFHLDLCRPFAAHCIGYPVVTLGFGFKSYVGFRMRLRRQKEVQKENEYYYEFLREALPPGPIREEAFNLNPQPSPKPHSEDRISEAPSTPGSSTSPNCTSSMDLLASSASSICTASMAAISLSSATLNGDAGTATSLASAASNGSLMSSTMVNGKHHHNGDLNHVSSIGASMSNGSLNNNAGGELDYMEKMRDDGDVEDRGFKRSAKPGNVAPRDASRKGRAFVASTTSTSSASPTKDEIIAKQEGDMKRLKVDLQLSRNKENDLREQIVSFMTAERTLKSEISNLQVEKSLLESRVNALMSTRAGEKATLSSLERKLADERKQKAEFQIKLETERKTKKEAANAERCAQQSQNRSEVAKLEAEIKTLRHELDRSRSISEAAEREAYQLRSYKEIHGDPEVLVGHLKNVQEKNRQLEMKLSEETKLKMDLFSALGEAKREISIRDNQVNRKEKEISDMQAKIAELLACMPTSSNRMRGSPVTVSGLANYVGSASGSVNSLSLDLPTATDLSSFTSGKLSGLGLADLEDKLTASLYTPASLGGTAYNPKNHNGNNNLD